MVLGLLALVVTFTSDLAGMSSSEPDLAWVQKAPPELGIPIGFSMEWFVSGINIAESCAVITSGDGGFDCLDTGGLFVLEGEFWQFYRTLGRFFLRVTPVEEHTFIVERGQLTVTYDYGGDDPPAEKSPVTEPSATWLLLGTLALALRSILH